jgi:Na+-driven multidrug efflux pump
MSIIAIGSVTVTFALNGQGAMAVAAYTAAQKIDAFATLPLNSFGAAMTTFTAQNYGARKPERIRLGTLQMTLVACAWSVFSGWVFYFAGGALSRIFIQGAEEVVAMSHFYLKVNGLTYPILAWLFISRQCLQGLGKSMITTLGGVMELVMRVLAAMILGALFGYWGVCFANTLAWAGAIIPFTLSIIPLLRRMKLGLLPESSSHTKNK